jgi:hypothetical protein
MMITHALQVKHLRKQLKDARRLTEGEKCLTAKKRVSFRK